MKLSPSKLSTFLDCGKKYEYKYIDHMSDPSGQAAVNGTAVHEALEYLYQEKPEDRSLELALAHLDDVLEAWPKVTIAVPDPNRCRELVWNLFDLEVPAYVNARKTEMDMLLPWFDEHELRGIVDRVDVEDDGYVIVDYKTGKAPSGKYLDSKMLGVKFYAMMGEKAFGVPPVRVKLLYLGTPATIVVDVTEGMVRGVEAKAKAAVDAIERTVSFRTSPSADACRFCPAANGVCPDAWKKKKK
jgi:putative RecB family exonuclease